MTPAEFWNATPREVAIVIDGASYRREEGQRLAVAAGWYAAAFERRKRLPSLERLLRRSEERTGRQSPEEMFRRIKALHLALGGDPRQLEKLKDLPAH